MLPLNLIRYDQVRHLNSLIANFTKIRRVTYKRLYPTVVVKPDGSSYTIRYADPRHIITLPLNLNTLTDAERKKRLERRRPKLKIVVEDDIDDGYDANQYLKYVQ